MGVSSSQKVITETHIFPVRVYYEDTDAAGIVYHANYLRFAERARTELLRNLNVNQRELAVRDGLQFVVRSCEIQYLATAGLDDKLTVESRITLVRGASVKARQLIKSEERDLVRLDMLIACVNVMGSPVRLPNSVRSALAAQIPDVSRGDDKWQL
jgi:acyl-CoA thioester hydrolase